jgi:RNA polymerase sigma-70 factor (ECF subfamily)
MNGGKRVRNSESKIIKKILSGQGELFEEIVDQYKSLIFKTCLEFMKTEQDALDMSQEVFIKIYNNLDKFEFKCKFNTWVYKICVNTCLTELKKKHRLELPMIEGYEYGSTPSPEEIYEVEEMKQLISDEIGSMSHKKKRILKLRMIGNHTFDKIAEILHLPGSSVRTEYTRAKSQITESLKKYNRGE